MDKNYRAKILFQKYLDRTASREELDEMFEIFEDKSRFASVYELFDREWESDDVIFDIGNVSLEEIRNDFERKRQKKSVKFGNENNRKRAGWRIGIAASILVLVGFTIWYFDSTDIIVYETGYGETKEIVLEDKSMVKLNANSRLTWSKDWEYSKERELTLDGEAFFKVKKVRVQPVGGGGEAVLNMPFRVRTTDLTVKVLGTSFNVASRRDMTDVYLESGKVELELKSEPGGDLESDIEVSDADKLDSSINIIVMEPGEAVSYSVSEDFFKKKNNRTTWDDASWIEGSLAFENERLEVILERLEDIYGKQFEVMDTALLNRNVNLGLPYEDWSTVSGLMTLSLEIEMTEKNDKVILQRKKGN